MSDQSTAPQPAPMRLWLRIVLVVSLAFNFMVIGLLIGVMASGGPLARDARGGSSEPLLRALSKEDRRAMWRDVRSGFRAQDLGPRTLRREFQTLLAAIEAEPFESAAVEASLARQRDFHSKRQDLTQAALVTRLEAMTPGERAAFADRLREALRRAARDRQAQPRRD